MICNSQKLVQITISIIHIQLRYLFDVFNYGSTSDDKTRNSSDSDQESTQGINLPDSPFASPMGNDISTHQRIGCCALQPNWPHNSSQHQLIKKTMPPTKPLVLQISKTTFNRDRHCPL